MEPTVALAILCHENVVYTLQKMSVFNTEFAEVATSILWMLGYGNTEGECLVVLTRVLIHVVSPYLYVPFFLLQILLGASTLPLLATNLASIRKPFHGVTMY